MTTTQTIIDRLKDKGVDYKIFEHEPVTTSEEAANVREGFSVEQGLKALVLKLHGAGDEFAMVVVPGDRNFDPFTGDRAIGKKADVYAKKPSIFGADEERYTLEGRSEYYISLLEE